MCCGETTDRNPHPDRIYSRCQRWAADGKCLRRLTIGTNVGMLTRVAVATTLSGVGIYGAWDTDLRTVREKFSTVDDHCLYIWICQRHGRLDEKLTAC